MRLRLRLLLTLLVAYYKRRLDLLDSSQLDMRVLPNDVDIRNVTNDRYHAFMDLGRQELITRFGFLLTMVRSGYAPAIRFTSIRYGYPLRLFQRFHLETSVVCWDADWVWFSQKFVRQGRTLASAYVKGCAVGKEGRVPTAVFLRVLGQQHRISPPMPEAVACMEAMEIAQREPVQAELSRR